MKKLLITVLISCIVATSFSVAQTNPLVSWIEGMSLTFGYNPSVNNISVKNITTTSITFESPVIRDENDQDVLRYVLWYGPHPLTKLLDGSTPAVDFKTKDFVFTAHTGSTFTMTLTTADQISASQTYYAAVLPIAANGSGGNMSGPDVCFKLQTMQHNVGSGCSQLGSLFTHNSASVNMSLANVDNTFNGNQITLTWTAIPGAEKVDIYLLDNVTQNGTKLGTPNMSAERFVFTLTKSAPNVVRFIPLGANGQPVGGELDYTIKQGLPTTQTPTTPSTPPKPGISKVPVVGPEQDILYIILASLFLYGVIRYARYRKLKH